jgi:hypothetical protein
MKKWRLLGIAVLALGAFQHADAALLSCFYTNYVNNVVDYGGIYGFEYGGSTINVGDSTPYAISNTLSLGGSAYCGYVAEVQSTGRAAVLSYTGVAAFYQYGPAGSASVAVTDVTTAFTRPNYSVGGGLTLWEANPGDSVTALTFTNGGFASAEAFVADAPTVSAANAVSYLSPLVRVADTSSPVVVTIGAISLDAHRSNMTIDGTGYASPFDDKVDFAGTLTLNGVLVGSYDYPLDFGIDDGTQDLSLNNDLKNVPVDFSGVTGSVADLKLQWAVVDNAYDATGTDNVIVLDGGTQDDLVTVPEPKSLSFASIGVLAVLARRKRAASSKP